MKVCVFGDKKWNDKNSNEKANENDMGSGLDEEDLQSCCFLLGIFLCYIKNSDYYTEEQAAFSTMTQLRACGLKFRVWSAGFEVCCKRFGLRFQGLGSREARNAVTFRLRI